MSLFHAGLQPALDDDGNPISGATWNFYRSGTLTALAVYAENSLATSLGAAVTADAAGNFADIYMDDDFSYRAILKDAGGSTRKDIDPANVAVSGGYFTPEQYGAVGDGTTDDYDALIDMIAAVNTAGGGVVRFKHDTTYYLDQYIASGNGVTTPEFSGCNGLTIEGNGAVIEVKGDIDRSVSTTAGMGALIFTDCTKLRIYDLEVDGNVELMTNSSGSNESGHSYGFLIRSCRDVVLENCHAHHFATDGFSFRGTTLDANSKKMACRKVKMVNCSGEYNSRLALSLIQVRGFVAEECSFSYTAQHEGTYGLGGVGHAPKAGFDIEPTDYLVTSAGVAGGQDINTGEITFRDCRFIDNLAGDWRANLPTITDTLKLESCRIESTTDNTGINCILLNIPGLTVRDCYIDLKGNWCTIGGSADHSSVFEYNEVRGSSRLLYSTANTSKNVIRYNDFIGTSTTADTELYFDINDTAAIVENNYFFLPKEAYTDAGAGDGHSGNPLRYRAARRIARNRYETDLLAASGSSGTAHFYVNYSGTGMDIQAEKFIGTATGTADTIRPGSSSTWNTTYLYGRDIVDWYPPGFYVGDGGTVTQATSKSTGVTLNELCGQITMNNAALAADTTVSFTLTNSTIQANDILTLNHVSGGTLGAYLLNAAAASGSATIYVRNITGGSLSEAIVIRFGVVRGAIT